MSREDIAIALIGLAVFDWVATVTLVNGINNVTIRARDEAGNVGTRQILVKALIPNSALGNQRNID